MHAVKLSMATTMRLLVSHHNHPHGIFVNLMCTHYFKIANQILVFLSDILRKAIALINCIILQTYNANLMNQTCSTPYN